MQKNLLNKLINRLESLLQNIENGKSLQDQYGVVRYKPFFNTYISCEEGFKSNYPDEYKKLNLEELPLYDGEGNEQFINLKMSTLVRQSQDILAVLKSMKKIQSHIWNKVTYFEFFSILAVIIAATWTVSMRVYKNRIDGLKETIIEYQKKTKVNKPIPTIKEADKTKSIPPDKLALRLAKAVSPNGVFAENKTMTFIYKNIVDSKVQIEVTSKTILKNSKNSEITKEWKMAQTSDTEPLSFEVQYLNSTNETILRNAKYIANNLDQSPSGSKFFSTSFEIPAKKSVEVKTTYQIYKMGGKTSDNYLSRIWILGSYTLILKVSKNLIKKHNFNLSTKAQAFSINIGEFTSGRPSENSDYIIDKFFISGPLGPGGGFLLFQNMVWE